MSLQKYLTLGANGGCLLFCGAGFSANCLNFSSDEVGTASPLHSALNDALDYQFADMEIAADEYIEKFGEHGLLSMLTEKYSISKRTTDVDNILKYPWHRIYTTNYDNVISQSLTDSGIRHYAANNTEKPFDVGKLAGSGTWVVHLHGALQKWEIRNFSNSCVLGRESYLRASNNSNWGSTLREDYARANAIFFVGFSNSDFYLAEHLFSAEASHDKVFFINSERAAEDRELLAKQKRYGTCFAIGTEKFSEMVTETIKIGGEPSLELHSFEHCHLPSESKERASVEQQYAFMVSGHEAPEAHFKDVLDGSISYRAPRNDTENVTDFLKKENAVALIVGGICSGKTLIFDECIMMLQTSGETVFRLRSKFYDLLAEVRSILEMHPTCVVAIDDCYSLKDDISEIVKYANGAGAKILLSSRSLAHDSEKDIGRMLMEGTPYQVFDTEILSFEEGETMISCTDRIGGWGATVSTTAQKRRRLEKDSSSRLSGFILSIFKAPHIRKRFKSELDVFKANGDSAEKVLILALYLRHIGVNVQENVLSEMLQFDAVKTIKSVHGGTEFISYDPKIKGFQVIASINSRDALLNLFDQKDVTDAVVEAVHNLEYVRYEPSFKHVFSQLMRYTQLKQVVADFSEQDRFFDRLSEIWFCKNHVLFWLQWSMAMRDHKKYPRAHQYLEEAYGRAVERGFDTDHLDDQKAGLVLDSVAENASSSEYLRCFRDSATLLNKMITKGAETSHNYLTIMSFGNFFQKAKNQLDAGHVPVIVSFLNVLRASVSKQLSKQHEGYVKNCMEDAVDTIDSSLAIVKTIQ